MELIGLYLAGCALLAAAGLAKLVHPAGTVGALHAAVGWRPVLLRRLVRSGATAEAALGAAALAFPARIPAALVAASYLTFTVFVAIVRRRGGPLSSCGCFSSPDTPATWLHAAINLGFAVSAAILAVAHPNGSLLTVLAHQPWSGAPLAFAGAACAWLAYLVMSPLAVLGQARHLPDGRAGRPR